MLGSEPIRSGVQLALVGEAHADAAGAGHEVVVREDVAVGVDDEARALAAPRHVERRRVDDTLVRVLARRPR